MNKKKVLPIVIGAVALLAVIGIIIGVIVSKSDRQLLKKDCAVIEKISSELMSISEELSDYVNDSWTYDEDANFVLLYEPDIDYCLKTRARIVTDATDYLKRQKKSGDSYLKKLK